MIACIQNDFSIVHQDLKEDISDCRSPLLYRDTSSQNALKRSVRCRSFCFTVIFFLMVSCSKVLETAPSRHSLSSWIWYFKESTTLAMCSQRISFSWISFMFQTRSLDGNFDISNRKNKKVVKHVRLKHSILCLFLCFSFHFKFACRQAQCPTSVYKMNWVRETFHITEKS